MGVGRIKRVADVTSPKVGARIRVRRADGSVFDGTVTKHDGADVVLDTGEVFSHADGDRLERYVRPERTHATKPEAEQAPAPTSYIYLHAIAYTLSLGTALFFALKYFGVV